MATKPKSSVTVGMIAKWASFFDSLGEKPFRRSDLAAMLYSSTSPRSKDHAIRAADKIIRDAAKKGEIVRFGHLHWQRVSVDGHARTIKSGAKVEALAKCIELNITTHCPRKMGCA